MTDDNNPATAPLGPALDFLQRLWQLNHALERLSSRMEKSFGVTAQQRLIVRFVGKYPGVAAGQLAALLHLDPGTISAALKRIEEKGLIARRRDAHDNRRVVLALTVKGRRLAHPVPGTVEHAVSRLLAGAHTSEIETAKNLLARLTRLLASPTNRATATRRATVKRVRGKAAAKRRSPRVRRRT